jgi:predicted transcriptional regulator
MGLREDILKRPVGELPLRQLVAVGRETTVRQAMARMREAKLGCAVVVDEAGKPLGKFTERVLMRLLVEGHSLDGKAASHMFGADDCVRADQPIQDMIRMMQTRHLRYIVVVDRQGKATDLTGQKGLMEFIADHFPRAVKVSPPAEKLHIDQREGA